MADEKIKSYIRQIIKEVLEEQEDSKFNLWMGKYLDDYLGVDSFKTEPKVMYWFIQRIFEGALRDSNEHGLVKSGEIAKIFKRGSLDGSRYEGKEKTFEGLAENKGIGIAKKAKWDIEKILYAFKWYCGLRLGHSVAVKIENIISNYFEN